MRSTPWPPELRLRAGVDAKGPLSFLRALNGAAALGPAGLARFAGRFRPKSVVAASFPPGAGAIAGMTLRLPPAPLLALVVPVGIGAQTRIHGFVAPYFPTTRIRAASVASGGSGAWAAR